MSDPVSELRAAVQDAASALRDGAEGESAAPNFERPPKPEFGDYSTNAAMLLAPTMGEKPRGIAERLAGELSDRLAERVDRVEVAGPGLLNLHLSDVWYRQAMAELAAAGDALGRPAEPAARRVLIEFVSANPTGPLTAAGGRHAAYGDAVARALEHVGTDVSREYYVNDMGGQIDRFADSIAARMGGEPVPEDGYEGDYVTALGERLAADGVEPGETEALKLRGVELMRAEIEETLRRYGVVFDAWSSERALHESGAVERALADLREAGHVYESEGATWLRTTSFGDDKDRVLVRSNGEPTYYTSDVAYHRDKIERVGDDGHLINVLGADHHGYVERLKVILAVFGYDPDRLEIPLIQLVHVV